MKALQKLVAVIALSLPLATLAQEAAKPAEPPKPTVTPYGFVLLNTFFNANTFVANDYPGAAARVQNGGSFLMSARQSRFGVKLAMNDDNWTGAALTGVIEFDFKGGHLPTTVPPTGTTLIGPNSTAWNGGLVRLRLASATATWKTGFGSVAVLAGQDYGLVNPLFATSTAYAADPIFWQAGNLWRRTPQIRVTWSNQFDMIGVNVAAAMLSPADATGFVVTSGAGIVSRMPDLEARAALSLKTSAVNGALGVGYHTNTKRYDVGAATAQDVTASVVGIDLDLNIPYVNLRGEYYDGKGTDDMYNSIGPGIAGTAGALYAPKTSGYWAQAVIKIIPEIWIPVGMGHAEAKLADVTAANTRFENDQIHGGVMFNAGKYWQFSVEAVQTTTKYNDAAQTKQDALQTTLNSKLSF